MQWVCDFCGYIHDDGEPPEICPVCGEHKSKFSEMYDDEEYPPADKYLRERSDDIDDYYEEYNE